MKTKRFFAIFLAAVMMVCTFAVSVSAANNTDVDFEIPIVNDYSNAANRISAQRLKEDASASYVNYTTTTSGASATGPYKVEAKIFGANSWGGTYVDCSSYTWDGIPRSKAIVTKGTKGFVRQDIYEKFGSGAYGQIWGHKASTSTTGTPRGCWSVDSVGSYSYYNDIL